MASDPSASYDFDYDDLGNVASEAQTIAGLTPALGFSRGYNPLGSMTSLAATIGGTADFKNVYRYDQQERLTQVTQEGVSGGQAVAFKRIEMGYDLSGLLTKVNRYTSLSAKQYVVSSYYQSGQPHLKPRSGSWLARRHSSSRHLCVSFSRCLWICPV